MEKIIRGKYLVRKKKIYNGSDILIVTGVFYPINFNLNEIGDNDEMWISDLMVIDGGLKFSDPINNNISPEDFLSGKNQMPISWKIKSKL